MTHLKKSLALLLAIVMIFSSMSVAASAADSESTAGNETVVFTIKFFRKDENGNWIETTKAAPGEHVKARAYVSTNYYTHSIVSSLLFDTDFFKAVQVTTDSEGNPVFNTFPQDEVVNHTSNPNYVVIDANNVQLTGGINIGERYKAEAKKFAQIPYLIKYGLISEDYFAGKEIIRSQMFMPTFMETVKLTDANNNWYDEYDFVIRNEENAVTKVVGEEGVAVVPKELRGTEKAVVDLKLGAMPVDVPKSQPGAEQVDIVILGNGWEIPDERFTSTEGVITTTSSVLLDANGGEFEDGSKAAEIKGIIKESIYNQINAAEVTPTRANHKLIGWSEIKTSKGAALTDEILSAIGYDEMSNEDIAALGWTGTDELAKKGYISEAEIGQPLTTEMVASIDLANMTRTQLSDFGLNVTTEILQMLAVDKANTKYDYDEYTLYALWDNSGMAPYTYETYLMGTDGVYSEVPTQEDTFYAAIGSTVPLQATAKEGFTFDETRSTPSVKVEADSENPSVLKAYYARNKYTVTYKYTDITGDHEETEDVYYDATLPVFDSLPSDEVELYMIDENGNKTSVIPEKMPAKNLVINAEIQITYLFDAGEGATFPSTGERTMTYVYKFGATPEIPEKPVKDGYTFVDWDVDIPATATGDMSFNAMYNPLAGTEESYTVTFYDKNGEVIDSSDGFWYGYEFEAVDIPEGYGDNVWKLADGTVVSFPYEIKADTEFYPVSEDANVYNAYFYENANDEEPYATSPTTYGEEIVAPEKEPEKYGHQFKGWSTDPEATTAEELGVMDSMEGKKFYAVFAPNEVTLKFNTDGGTAIADMTGKFGEELKAPETTKDGFTFGGWYDKDGKPVLLPETFPAESAEYTAKWNANTYNVIYKSGSELIGEIGTAKTEETVAVNDGSAVKKEGHTFAGWKSDADNVIYNNPLDNESPASFVMPGKNVTLEAQWNVNKHVVILDANGGAFEDGEGIYANDEVNYGTVLSDAGIPADPEWPTDEKVFKGWADADDVSETIVYAPGELQSEKMPDEGLNLVAIWDDVKIPTYTATFITIDGTFTDKDGNEVKEISYDYKAGDLITPPVPTRDDGDYIYTWVPSLPIGNIMPAKDMTFVVQWEEVVPGSIGYTITPMIQILNDDGTTSYIQGTVLNKTGEEGQTVEITVDGNSESDFTWIYSGLIKGDNNIPAPNHPDNVLAVRLTKDGNNALVAYFDLAKRNIELDANGGNLADGIAAKQELLHGTVITLPTADETTKDRFVLTGWQDSKGNPYEPGEKVSVTGDEKYEAVWEEKTYTLTFNEDGGTPEPTDPILAQDEIYNVPAVRKDDYRFNGWKDENDNVYKAGEPFTMPAEDVTLTADWIRVYTVSYTDAEGNELKTGVAAENEDVPVYTGNVPSQDGYRFGGWENMPEDGKMPANDLVLKPVFNKIYTLTYKYDVEDSALPALPASEELIAGETTTVKALPELEGYRFYGWDNEGTTYKPWDTFTMPAKDTELVVTYEEIVKYSLTFHENGGTEVDDVTLEAGEEYRLPTSSREGGWILKGWNDGSGTYPAGEIYVMPDLDTELNAVWVREITTAEPTTAPTYYISFVYDGEAPEGADELLKDYPVKGGESYRLPALSSVDGIKFDYWYDSNNVKYPANYEYVVKGDMTFVAKWTEESTAPVPTEPVPTEPTTLAKYTLNFDYENGIKPDGAPTLPRDIIVEDGKTHELPELPKLDGYEFDGWYDENGVRYPAGYNYRVTGDVTLFAKWAEKATEPTTEPTTQPTTTEAPKYELSFKHEATTPSNAPELPETEELKAGQVYVLPELDDIEGFEFKGWKDEKGASYAAGYAFRMPAEATVLYADYDEIVAEPTKVKLTFDEKDGTPVEDMELLPGVIINLPKTELNGYEFIGWNDGEKVYAAGEAYKMPATDKTLTAEWREIPVKTFNVSYAYIGEDTPTSADPVPAEKVITENDMVVVEAYPSAVEGYEFFGWYLNGKLYKPGDTFAPEFDPMVFEGFWVKKTATFVVSYKYEGDIPADAAALPEFKTYNDGETVTVAAKPAAVEGYTFEGWFLDEDRSVEVTQVTINGDNVVLVGVWTIHKNDIVFDANDGEFKDGSAQTIVPDVEYGSDIEDLLPEIPKKEGHTFVEWEGMPEDGKMPDEGLELKAKWQINKYTITFDSNGGSEVPSATYEYGAVVTEPAAPTRENFVFVGWQPELPGTMPANDLTVKAVWEAAPGVTTHKLTADANGGKFADGSDEFTKDYVSGDEIGELPVPTRDGYEFKGWENLPENGKIESDITIKAIWEEKEPEVKSHTVNYYLVKGEGAEAELYTSKTFEEGAALEHPTPVIEGFTFKGWTDENGNALPETMETEDINAYAQLEINTYKVTYISDGEVYEEYTDVKFASEVPVPADPAKAGYVFAGWEPAVVSTMPAHDLTYTAKWVTAPVDGEKYTARYVVDGRTYDLHVLEEGDAIPVPAAPTKFGYVFVGWEPEVPETMPAENLEFVAQWEIDKTFVGLVIGGTVVSGAIVGTVIGMNAALITGAAIVGGIIVIVGAVHLAKHTHTVTFMVDGEVYKVYKVVEGTKIPVPADPAKDGAEFAGWNPEVPEKMGNTDLVFEATWEDVGSDVDVAIPDTGSIAGVTAFAIISGAAAAAYVITRKKKED